MSFNAASKYPEYYTNQNEEIYPDKDSNYAGWVLWRKEKKLDNINQNRRTK